MASKTADPFIGPIYVAPFTAALATSALTASWAVWSKEAALATTALHSTQSQFSTQSINATSSITASYQTKSLVYSITDNYVECIDLATPPTFSNDIAPISIYGSGNYGHKFFDRELQSLYLRDIPKDNRIALFGIGATALQITSQTTPIFNIKHQTGLTTWYTQAIWGTPHPVLVIEPLENRFMYSHRSGTGTVNGPISHEIYKNGTEIWYTSSGAELTKSVQIDANTHLPLEVWSGSGTSSIAFHREGTIIAEGFVASHLSERVIFHSTERKAPTLNAANSDLTFRDYRWGQKFVKAGGEGDFKNQECRVLYCDWVPRYGDRYINFYTRIFVNADLEYGGAAAPAGEYKVSLIWEDEDGYVEVWSTSSGADPSNIAFFTAPLLDMNGRTSYKDNQVTSGALKIKSELTGGNALANITWSIDNICISVTPWTSGVIDYNTAQPGHAYYREDDSDEYQET